MKDNTFHRDFMVFEVEGPDVVAFTASSPEELADKLAGAFYELGSEEIEGQALEMAAHLLRPDGGLIVHYPSGLVAVSGKFELALFKAADQPGRVAAWLACQGKGTDG